MYILVRVHVHVHGTIDREVKEALSTNKTVKSPALLGDYCSNGECMYPVKKRETLLSYEEWDMICINWGKGFEKMANLDRQPSLYLKLFLFFSFSNEAVVVHSD